VRTFLVSPAIIRRYEKANLSFLQKALKKVLPENLVSLLRDIYLTQVVKNPFYSKATGVMRATYRNIVAVDLRDDLLDLRVPVTLIYGEKDTATPPEFVREVVGNAKAKHELCVIPSAGHDIANSHTTELVNIIAEAMGKEFRI
ncbi:MAG: alpha/beta hydrolase, partial [Candidatus Zambryskibacteria bacterium]|nr:alpha/beta hydrolase [Candidatus Zambryskibacteria bacterium]